MKTPNITTAQIAALLTALGGQAVAYGLLSDHTAQIAVSVVSAAIAVAWKFADAIIRNGRARSLHGARAAAIHEEAALTSITEPVPSAAASTPSAPPVAATSP